MCDYEAEYSAIIFAEDKIAEYKCPHRSLKKVDKDGKSYCIFHSKIEDKDVEKFYKEFKELYNKGEHNFTGFVFPKDFSFKRLRDETEGLGFSNAIFTEALFICDAYFAGATFSSDNMTSFYGAKFVGDGNANFMDTDFSGKGLTNFRNVQFSNKGSVNFALTQFNSEGGTNFNGIQFYNKRGTYFIQTLFSSKGGIYFKKADFSSEGEVIFKGKLFSEETEVDFRDVTFETPGNVTFDGVNLSKCRLIGTDLEHINIKEVFWKNKKKDSCWRWGRMKVYEETLQTAIFKCGGERNHYEVYQLYNQLLLNYERTYRHHEAGDFYAGQMDMRRRGNLDRKIFSLIILTLYKGVSEYGERPVRVLGWLLFTLLAFGLIYAWIGIEGPPIFESFHYLNEYVKGLIVSLDIMTIGKVKEIFRTAYTLNSKDGLCASLAKLGHVISSASLLTLFLLSVRRRFRKV